MKVYDDYETLNKNHPDIDDYFFTSCLKEIRERCDTQKEFYFLMDSSICDIEYLDVKIILDIDKMDGWDWKFVYTIIVRNCHVGEGHESIVIKNGVVNNAKKVKYINNDGMVSIGINHNFKTLYDTYMEDKQ